MIVKSTEFFCWSRDIFETNVQLIHATLQVLDRPVGHLYEVSLHPVTRQRRELAVIRKYSFQDLWFGSKNNEASSVGLESIQNQRTSWSNCNERQFEQEHERSRWKTLQHSFVGFGFCVLETSTWNRRSQTTINTIISARNSGNCAILFQNGNLSIRCNYAVLSPLSKSDVLIIDFSEQKLIIFQSKKWLFFVFKLFGKLKWSLELISDVFWHVFAVQTF